MFPLIHSPAKRIGRAALAAAVAAGLASFCLVWQVLKPAASPQPQLAAVARMRGPSDDTQLAQRELAVAALLSPENLSAAMRDAGLPTDASETALGHRDSVEKVRERLRIELGAADAAGMQTVAIRWTGEASPSTARLVNLLARRLAQRLSAPDTASQEAAHNLARQTVREASKALSEARGRLASAVTAAGSVQEPEPASPVPANEDSEAPHLAPPREAVRDRGFLLGQQLADLESRRQTLSERLMPEHPEMKALDAEIAVLRTRLADQPPPQDAAYVRRTAPEPIAPSTRASDHQAVTAQIAELADELAAAQAEYESAAAQERVAWQAINARRNGDVTQIEPAVVASVPSAGQPWQRWLIASLCGLMSFALVLAFWPRPRLTFSTVEEVRAVTRLPVVAVSRRSLN